MFFYKHINHTLNVFIQHLCTYLMVRLSSFYCPTERFTRQLLLKCCFPGMNMNHVFLYWDLNNRGLVNPLRPTLQVHQDTVLYFYMLWCHLLWCSYISHIDKTVIPQTSMICFDLCLKYNNKTLQSAINHWTNKPCKKHIWKKNV